jgi:hypothetical protein
MHDQHVGELGAEAHRREIAQRIERKLAPERRHDRETR